MSTALARVCAESGMQIADCYCLNCEDDRDILTALRQRKYEIVGTDQLNEREREAALLAIEEKIRDKEASL